MIVTLWGTRGSLPASGPETQVFGGNTPCVGITAGDHFLILDAGSGIRRLGLSLDSRFTRVDILLTHLHMDHIQGMGFFKPLFRPGFEVHIWGPAGTNSPLVTRLNRYLSPPLFPVRLRDLPCDLHFHEVPRGPFHIGSLEILARYVNHPGPTVGYRISDGKAVLAYLPDHEPALGVDDFPKAPEWTSGIDLARGADLLIHDAQFTSEEYDQRVGWGHSSFRHALAFARLAQVKHLLLFHHDPAHSDQELLRFLSDQTTAGRLPFRVSLAREGETFNLIP